MVKSKMASKTMRRPMMVQNMEKKMMPIVEIRSRFFSKPNNFVV